VGFIYAGSDYFSRTILVFKDYLQNYTFNEVGVKLIFFIPRGCTGQDWKGKGKGN